MAETLLVVESLDKVYGEGVAATQLCAASASSWPGASSHLSSASPARAVHPLNLIGLLDTPTAGTVRFNGQSIAELNRKGRASLRNELVGFVFQFHYLLPEFSVFENVAMPALIGGKLTPAEIRERVDETLALLGLRGTPIRTPISSPADRSSGSPSHARADQPAAGS